MEWKKNLINFLLIAALGVSMWVFFNEFVKDFRDMTILFSSVIFFVALLICLFLFNKKGLAKEEQYQVVIQDEMIHCMHPEKPNETVSWKAIAEVVIITTDKGPEDPYIWILLSTEKGEGCIFPLGAKNSKMAIEKILGLPGLNLSLWAEALKSTSNNRYVVWKK